ncbi:MAG: M67 family metallopeptidase [Solirubrobacteraceae bacterium]|nr:M67 family metallopeptidase [Solirubrobacteraceae bacterium]
MRITSEALDAVVAHARRDAPDECCGVLGVRDGVVTSVHELENALQGPKPWGFEIAPQDLLRVYNEIEDAGADLGVIYHSHTRSAPYPSQTDINFAAGWPGVEWLIVGTQADEPEIRSYLIDGGTVTEVDVVVEG